MNKAIQTKYFPCTNTKPARIKAFLPDCQSNGFIWVTDDDSGEQAHKNAAKKLIEKFIADDETRHGKGTSKWNMPVFSAYLKAGHYVHILVNKEDGERVGTFFKMAEFFSVNR